MRLPYHKKIRLNVLSTWMQPGGCTSKLWIGYLFLFKSNNLDSIVFFPHHGLWLAAYTHGIDTVLLNSHFLSCILNVAKNPCMLYHFTNVLSTVVWKMVNLKFIAFMKSAAKDVFSIMFQSIDFY